MRLHKGRIAGAAVILVLICLGVLWAACTYTVSEIEQVVITQFGRPVREVTEPGLKFKKPFVQMVNRLEKRILAWDGEPDRMPTKDKKNIYIDVWARWKITKPMQFFTAVRTTQRGQKILDDIVDSVVRDVVGKYNLIEVVRSTNRKLVYEIEDKVQEDRAHRYNVEVGRAKMEEEILDKSSRALDEDTYGMKLVDVKIKRINYVESVRKSVYKRMEAERLRIAARYASEAEEQREIILGETQKELAVIQGDGEQKSKEIKGKADAEAIKIYGEAFSKDPEFYAFLRALEAYKAALTKDTELILSTDSPFLKWMREEMKLSKPQSRPAGVK